MMAAAAAGAAEARRAQGVVIPVSASASIHVHRSTSTRRVVGITWFSCFVIIVALLLAQDDSASAMMSSENDRPKNRSESSSLERGKVMSDSITADELYDAYREIQMDYHQKAFSAKQPWKILNRKDGVEVAMLENAADRNCPYVRMKARIPASVKHCWDFLQLDQWEETMPKMDPFYEGVSILGEYAKRGVEMVLARKRTKKILAFGKRDFVFVSVSDHPLPDGTWVSGTVSVVSPNIPRQGGYTRAFQDSIAYYRPISKDETEVTIVCRIDLNDSAVDGAGGSIPMWLYVKTIGATGARSVISMRNALLQQQQQQQQAEEERELEELEREHEGMRFSLPRQVPVLPRKEERIRKKLNEKERQREKNKRDKEAMRFSLPWQVPVLPHDETRRARKIRGGKNDEPKRRIPWMANRKDDDADDNEQRVLGWFRRRQNSKDDVLENDRVVERMAWFRSFSAIFRGKKGVGPQ